MKKIDLLTEEFKSKYERFLIGCDAIEELDQWDKEAHGEMDVFYQNDLVSVILRLIAVDGEIGAKEVEYLNEIFGFDYSLDELVDVYESCEDNIDRSFDEIFKNGVTVMRSINEKLANAYKELLELICDIIIASDENIAPEEMIEVGKLKKLFTE